MKKVVEYEVSYDITSEVTYLGEEEPGEYYFRIHRQWAELIFDDEEDEAKAIVNHEGAIEVEGYSSIREEEVKAIGEMMNKILKSKI